MKCSKIQKNLSDYLDNALPNNEKEEIADHLLTCPSCRKEFSTLRRLKDTLNFSDDMSVPNGFSDKLIGKIIETKQKTEITVPHAMLCRTVMAAACAAVLLSSILFCNHIGKTFYKKTAGKRSPRDSRVIEALKTQARIELAGYLENNLKYDVQPGGEQ